MADPTVASLAFIDGLGGPEMILVFVVILLLFGGKKLPEFARGLGKTMREFKKAASGVEDEFRRALEEDERRKYAPPPPPPAPVTVQPATNPPTDDATNAAADEISATTPLESGTPSESHPEPGAQPDSMDHPESGSDQPPAPQPVSDAGVPPEPETIDDESVRRPAPKAAPAAGGGQSSDSD